LRHAGLTRYPRPMTDLTQLEERIAHLTRMVDDLSDVIARQDRTIAALVARVTHLSERDAARDTPEANQRPPHW
jgi:SlyX protein